MTKQKTKPDPTVTHRNDLIKAFITKADMCRVDEVPECFGGLPQGNESAWAKGCKQCPLYTDSSSCADATHVCNEIYWHKKKYVLVTKKFICDYCAGAGSLLVINSNGTTRRCEKCEGSGTLTTNTMEEKT